MNMKMMRMRMMLIIASIGIGIGVGVGRVEGMWCVARSDASEEALQRGLDYACAAGADCVPIQENGMCYLPNTLQAHASYAFNSYYQRSNMAPASCDFSGTATLAKTDPSTSLPFHLCLFILLLLPHINIHSLLLFYSIS